MDDRSRITVWLDPFGATVCSGCGNHKSKYGAVTNQQWLMREMERINQSGKQCCIKSSPEGEQALFYISGHYNLGQWVQNEQAKQGEEILVRSVG